MSQKALGLHVREKAENVPLFVDLFIVYNKIYRNKNLKSKIKRNQKIMNNRIIQSDSWLQN